MAANWLETSAKFMQLTKNLNMLHQCPDVECRECGHLFHGAQRRNSSSTTMTSIVNVYGWLYGFHSQCLRLRRPQPVSTSMVLWTHSQCLRQAIIAERVVWRMRRGLFGYSQLRKHDLRH